jgi:putative Mg2+ transporter-C (MgtC) family protein
MISQAVIPATAMLAQPFSFGNIEQKLMSNEAVLRLLVACACGALVGIEREWKNKSAGVRTNLLICMGCAFFTQMSPILAGDNGNNRGQVAANIVQGIGFLGAGLILHNRNRVSGLASAASIFVVASIGMACGAGLFLPAAIATAIVLAALWLVGVVEWRINLKTYPLIYETRGTDPARMMTSILDAMDRENQHLEGVERDTIGIIERACFTVQTSKRGHERLKKRLSDEPAIDSLKIFRDPEED